MLGIAPIRYQQLPLIVNPIQIFAVDHLNTPKPPRASLRIAPVRAAGDAGTNRQRRHQSAGRTAPNGFALLSAATQRALLARANTPGAAKP